MIADLAVFEQFEADIVKFEQVNAELSFDVETEDGEKDCKKYLGKLRKVRNGIERLRKDTKKQYLEAGRAVDAEAKSFIGRVDDMHDIHNAPIKALEQKRLDAEIDKREKEQAELKRIEDERLADLQAREEAANAKEAALKEKEDAIKAEEDKIQRDKEIKEAQAKAAEDAKNQAKQDAIDMAARVEREKEETAKQAELDKQAAIDAEKKRAADKYAAEQAEKDKIAEETRKRQADVEHRKEFNNLALDAITAITGDIVSSLELVQAIIKGQIPNVTMNY